MTPRGRAPGDVVAAARHAEELGFESVWATDQLVAGTGRPVLESVVALAATAGATSRVELGFGVLIAPLRPVAWIAKQVATLQQVSGDRVLLGLGVGGDTHQLSWQAVSVPSEERGRRLDATLRAVPGLIAGEPTTVDIEDGAPVVELSPAATVPPLSIGGMSAKALERVVRYADDWYLLPVPPEAVAEARGQLTAALEAAGRPADAVTVTVSIMCLLDGDPAAPDQDELVRQMTDPDGVYGMPAEAVPDVVTTAGPAEIADLVRRHVDAGADRVIFSLVAGDWHRQASLAAEAAQLAVR